MIQKQSLLRVVARRAGLLFGLISIGGGMAAWSSSRSGEQERYLVSALVMILGGIFWIVPSVLPKYSFSQKHSMFLLTIVFLGLMLGLVSTFSSCGGECGMGASFCRWEYGYPGRWLRTGGCYDPLETVQLARGNWKIDIPNLVADLVFWAAAGVIILFLWNTVRSSATPAVTKNKLS